MAPRNKPGIQGKGESLTVRIEPRLRWGLELLARKQRRTMSSVVEWAILRAIKSEDEGLDYSYTDREGDNVKRNLLDVTWTIEESERIANLAFNAPHLMTYEEEVLWQATKDAGLVWKGHYDKNGDWEWTPYEQYLNLKRLRQYWPIIKKVAAGEEPRSKLPQVVQKDTSLDDEIPF